MTEDRKVEPGDPGYPVGLFDLEEPPALYVLGDTSTAPAVAVVGTRRCTRYGLTLAHAFGRALADADGPRLADLPAGSTAPHIEALLELAVRR